MAIIETTWKPTANSVEKKNTKYGLSSALIDIWRIVDECKDAETKKKLLDVLLRVL